MRINNRLKMVGDLVEEDSLTMDVGCDHALLSIYLVLKKKQKRAIASDIKEGPLESAKENIKRYQVEEVKEALRKEMQNILEVCDNTLKLETKPAVILIVGVNGVRKNYINWKDCK